VTVDHVAAPGVGREQADAAGRVWVEWAFVDGAAGEKTCEPSLSRAATPHLRNDT